MFKKIILLLFVVSFASLKDAKAQDPAFSQFLVNPLYLNPAMAGSDICPRISLNHRNQWPALAKRM